MTKNRIGISIMGTRGVPARHGGFETFAERLAPYLAQCGWDVTVYCQRDRAAGGITEDTWCGVRRIHVPTRARGALATLEFDLRATIHATRRNDLKLVLGYNTAVLNLLLRAFGRRVVLNMDGLEWMRSKWRLPARLWLRVNEWIGAVSSHRLVADHPEIARHLATLRGSAPVTTIPYGADRFEGSLRAVLERYDLAEHPYFVVVARIEPENSILEIVEAVSKRPMRARLVVLGTLDPSANPYHARVLAAASDECMFLGAIYERDVVAALRAGALAYVHGHTVGGTNPSLVEALGAGAAIVAHDNPFNRWVAGEAASYFGSARECREAIDAIATVPELRSSRRDAARSRHEEAFLWSSVLDAYREMLAVEASGGPRGHA